MNFSHKLWPILFLILVFGACSDRSAEQSGANDSRDWLGSGSTDERFAKVSRHLRGFDMAMAEVGYRFTELYWAGGDQNWEYAKYHLEKIRTAIKNGLERRPARAQSAQMIYPSLDALEKALNDRDPKAFGSSIKVVRQTCNACHQAEKVPFIQVEFATQRLSPVQLKGKAQKKD